MQPRQGNHLDSLFDSLNIQARNKNHVPVYTSGLLPAFAESPFGISTISYQRILAEKRYKNKEYLEAFLCYYELFNLSEKEYDAAYYMGHMLYEGLGVQVNYNKAYEWFLRAATGGYSKAYAKLGDCYYHGRGQMQSYSVAAQWYQKGIDSGDAIANKGLGMIYYYTKIGGKDLSRALQYFLNAALHTEDKDAQFHVGLYCQFIEGGESGRFQAVGWHKQAAAQGHIMAAFNASNLYFEGLDQRTPPDYAMAYRYNRQAAEGNHAVAMCNVGYYYELGRGVVDIDYRKAFKWYKKASFAGNFQAAQNLGKLYMKGLGTEKDLLLALKCFIKAKEGGIVESDDYIRQVENMRRLSYSEQNNNRTFALQEEVLALRNKLQQVQNETQVQLDKKDRKITELLDQMTVQNARKKKLFFQMGFG